jgi:hypothetical protein
MLYKNLKGTTKENFSLGLKDKKVEIVPDHSRRNLVIWGGNGDVWTVGVLPILIAFDFSGVTPPAPGSNEGLFGMCRHTSGIYGAGIPYYDTGSALLPVKVFIGLSITTTNAMADEISLIENSLYVAQSDSNLFDWTLKGGQGSFTPSTVPVDEPLINIINDTEEFCYDVNHDIVVDKVFY